MQMADFDSTADSCGDLAYTGISATSREQMITPRNKHESLPQGRMQYALQSKGAEFRVGDLANARSSARVKGFPADLAAQPRTGSISVLRIHDPPLAIAEMIEEVNHVTPKQIVFLDSRPLQNTGTPGAVHWCDTATCPTVIAIFLNPETATPQVLAHEINHAWIEFCLQYEDRREWHIVKE
jgi:hypothetical protein